MLDDVHTKNVIIEFSLVLCSSTLCAHLPILRWIITAGRDNVSLHLCEFYVDHHSVVDVRCVMG